MVDLCSILCNRKMKAYTKHVRNILFDTIFILNLMKLFGEAKVWEGGWTDMAQIDVHYVSILFILFR